MNDPENFESLKKLLTLKRHEQPPPGYFNDLPQQVWSCLERGEAEPVSFLEKYFSRNGMNPAVAYGFGLVVCATLVFGIGYTLKTEPETTLAQPMPDDTWRLISPIPALASEVKPLNFSPYHSKLSSTNPVIGSEPSPSLFNGLNLRVEPASYEISPR